MGQGGMSSSKNLWVLVGLGLAGVFILSRRQRKEVKEANGAFIQLLKLLPPPPPPPPIAPHPLTGLTFAVKDIFDIKDFITGFGNPEWANTHEAAIQTAAAVALLVQAGAECIGKTHMDEFAYSLIGENKHYGTPVNPAAPSRIPGGSSSGSAVVVAAELVDFSLGTDTGGSVRVPAAICGIFGFRPSHGAVSTVGVTPMAQSFDTVGWFARDPKVLRQVGYVLLQLPFTDLRQPRRIIIADDCFQFSSVPQDHTKMVVIRALEKTLGRQIVSHMNLGDYLESNVPGLKEFLEDGECKGPKMGVLALTALSRALSLIQRFEFKTNHEEWFTEVNPELGPGIKERVQEALAATPEKIPQAMKIRDDARSAMADLLKNDTILVLPTTSGPPPKLNSKKRVLDEFRAKSFALTSVAGMSGCCQVSAPLGKVDNIPVAVSLVARQGGDRFLLDALLKFYPSFQEEAEGARGAHDSQGTQSSRPDAAEQAKEKGNTAFKNRDYHKAVNFYSEAIRFDSTNSTYYSNRAAAYLALCSFQQVESDCDRAIELDKKNVKAYLRRGTSRELLGSYREADEDFKQALILEPTNRTALDGVKRLKKLLFD